MPIWRRWWWELGLSFKARLGTTGTTGYYWVERHRHYYCESQFVTMRVFDDVIVVDCDDENWWLFCHSRWGSVWHLIIICDCETQWLWLNGNRWYWMILHNTYISYAWYYRYTHIQSCHSIERADFGFPPSWSGSLGWEKDIPNNRQKTLKQSQAVSVPDLTMRSAVIEIFGCFEAWNYSLASRPALLLGWVLELIVWELNCSAPTIQPTPTFSSTQSRKSKRARISS